MKLHRIAAVALAVALFAAFVTAEEKALKSGPQVDEELAGPFSPLNINGKKAGDKNCLYCSNGANPVAMIFAREPSEELTKLVKKLDAACEKHKEAKLGSFIVFCAKSDEDLETKLKKCAKDCDLKHVVLSIDNPAGPEGYKVAKEADITVVLYVKRTAKANWAFKKGEFKEKHIDTVVDGLSKILPKE
jgi:hypothetical protein